MLEKEKYESRYLISVISAIINQTEIPHTARNLDWENLYKLSEYHKVSHIMYFGLLGMDEDVGKKWKNLFRARYEESLLSQDRYRNTAEMVMWQLKQNKIHALLIKDGIMSTCYEPKEVRALAQVRILVGDGQDAKIHSLMRSMDFQKQENKRVCGEVYYRIPKTTVVFYTDLGFKTRRLRKYFDFPVKVIHQMEGQKYLHQFTEDEFFIYLVCDLVNLYACGEIKISDMVDFWQFYKKYQKRLNWEYIDKELSIAGVLDFAQRLQKVALLWFGGWNEELSREYDADANIYQAMEAYILTRGIEGREISSQLTVLIREASHVLAKERREERVRRYRKFVFPDRKYMEKIFPILEDAPFLLPLCWVWRSFLLLLLPFRKKLYRLFNPIRRTVSDTVESIRQRREDRLIRRMDEAVRKVMEESSYTVRQEVHNILGDDGSENKEGPESGTQGKGGESSGSPEASEMPEVPETSKGSKNPEPSEEESWDLLERLEEQERERESSDHPEEKPADIFGMKDFFMDSDK